MAVGSSLQSMSTSASASAVSTAGKVGVGGVGVAYLLTSGLNPLPLAHASSVVTVRPPRTVFWQQDWSGLFDTAVPTKKTERSDGIYELGNAHNCARLDVSQMFPQCC